MPYGGVKQSGFGREGVKYTIEEMTEMNLLFSRARRNIFKIWHVKRKETCG